MTTNSPNPVDGDVQALIDTAREDIKFLEGVREKRGHLFELEEQKLALIKIALAALKAPGRKVFTCSGCGCENFDEPNESDCHCFIEGREWVESMVYTNPPAQLLRPVELPDIRRFCSSHINCKRANELLSEALRQQGYEVKS